MTEPKKINEMWNRKQLPKKETATIPLKEQLEAVKQNTEAIKAELKDKPEIKEVAANLKEQGYSQKEIADMINKAGDTFIDKLLAAIQGEQAKEQNPTPKPEVKEPEKHPEIKKGIFGR